MLTRPTPRVALRSRRASPADLAPPRPQVARLRVVAIVPRVTFRRWHRGHSAIRAARVSLLTRPTPQVVLRSRRASPADLAPPRQQVARLRVVATVPRAVFRQLHRRRSAMSAIPGSTHPRPMQLLALMLVRVSALQGASRDLRPRRPLRRLARCAQSVNSSPAIAKSCAMFVHWASSQRRRAQPAARRDLAARQDDTVTQIRFQVSHSVATVQWVNLRVHKVV